MGKTEYSSEDILMAILNDVRGLVNLQKSMHANARLDSLHNELRVSQPGNPAAYGWKSHSQNDEDGIIRYCLQKIGEVAELKKNFVEIGIGRGYENNTHQLVLDGYSGCWIDGNPEFINIIRKQLPPAQKKLQLIEAFVTLKNLPDLMDECLKHLGGSDVDFFSLDVDGNDYYFAPICIEKLKPKLVCVEYNGKFPPPTVLYMKYNASYVWDRTEYQGASLQAFVDSLPGYKLVACSVVGINAFFVRNDFAGLFGDYSPEEIYQPARMELGALQQGHTPSLGWLWQTLMFR